MAGTFYKYAERNVESQINWAEVGKSVVDMLREENQLREEKKAAIDEATREQLEVLKNAPLGDNENLNSYVLGLADEGTNYLLMQHRLLKSGQTKPKDYLVMSQNLNSDTNLMFETAKGLQTKYSEVMERLQKNENQETEVWLLEQVQNLAKFTGTQAKINPVTGMIDISQMVKDPKTGQMVIGKSMSIRELANYSNIRLDKYDVDAANAKAVDGLGQEIASNLERVKGAYKLFKLTEIEDITARGALPDVAKEELAPYLKWEEAKIKELTVNPFHKLSILTENLEGYSPTDDPEEAKADPKKILIEKLPSGQIRPVFTEEQTKAVETYMRNDIRMRLDKKTTISTATEPLPHARPASLQEKDYDKGQAKDAINNIAGDFALLYRGTPAERNQAANSIRSKNDNILDVTYDDVGATITFKDGTQIPMPFGDMSEGQWASSNVVAVLPEGLRKKVEEFGFDVKDSYEKSAGGKNWGNTKHGSGAGSVSKNVQAGLFESADNKAIKTVMSFTGAKTEEEAADKTIIYDDESQTVDNLNSYIRTMQLGDIAKSYEAYPGYDYIKVKDAQNNVIFELDLDKAYTPEQKRGELRRMAAAIANSAKSHFDDPKNYLLFEADYTRKNPVYKKPSTGPLDPTKKGPLDPENTEGETEGE